jgi:hypothetical protein
MNNKFISHRNNTKVTHSNISVSVDPQKDVISYVEGCLSKEEKGKDSQILAAGALTIDFFDVADISLEKFALDNDSDFSDSLVAFLEEIHLSPALEWIEEHPRNDFANDGDFLEELLAFLEGLDDDRVEDWLCIHNPVYAQELHYAFTSLATTPTIPGDEALRLFC